MTILTSDGVNLTVDYIANMELFDKVVAEDDPHTHEEWKKVLEKVRGIKK